jgi:hypothetical protein
MLIDAARAVSVAELHAVIAYWRRRVDAGRAAMNEVIRYERRALYVSPLLDGMVRVDADLDPETGQVLMTALAAVCDAEARARGGDPDLRSPAQRRADALGEVCRQWLDSATRPTVGGERPHVIVTIDLESLEARAGRRCELRDASVITAEAARRLACDAEVTRVIVDARSEPLDVGRRTKVVSPPLRRAVIVRDGGCRVPGCERLPGPRLRAAAGVVRHASRGALGGRRGDRAREPRPAVSAAPSADPSARVRRRDAARPHVVHETRRIDAAGP